GAGTGGAGVGGTGGGTGGTAGGSPGRVIFSRSDYPATAPEAIAVADVHGKNGPDGVGAFPNAASIGVLPNKGDGTLADPVTVPPWEYPFGIALGDLTSPAGTFGPGAGDGKVDVVLACPYQIGVMAGNGDGTFAAAQLYQIGVPFPTGSITSELVQ